MESNREKLMEYAKQHLQIGEDRDVLQNDCDILVYLLEHCEITVPKTNRFFVQVDCAEIMNYLTWERCDGFRQEIIDAGLAEGEEVLAYTGLIDISHTTPEWENVISLGFVGIRNRVRKYAEINSGDAGKQRFYSNVIRVYDAIIYFLKRAAEKAKDCGKQEMAEGLEALTRREPRNHGALL